MGGFSFPQDILMTIMDLIISQDINESKTPNPTSGTLCLANDFHGLKSNCSNG